MVSIFRYSDSANLVCKPVDHIFKLKNSNIEEWTSGIFFSSDFVNNTSCAKAYMSLTKAPGSWFEYDFIDVNSKFLNNLRDRFNFNSIPKFQKRSWPAFGKHGGAYEVIWLCDDGTSATLRNTDNLSFNAVSDFFHMDNVSITYVKDLIAKVAKSLNNLFSTMGIFDSDAFDREGGFSGKVMNNQNFVIFWSGEKRVNSGIKFSISVGTKEITTASTKKLLVGFWGNMWLDVIGEDPVLNTCFDKFTKEARILWNAYYRTLCLNVSSDQLKVELQSQNPGSNLLIEIDSVLCELVLTLLNVYDNSSWIKPEIIAL